MKKGELDAQAVWLRILKVIETLLSEQPPDAYEGVVTPRGGVRSSSAANLRYAASWRKKIAPRPAIVGS